VKTSARRHATWLIHSHKASSLLIHSHKTSSLSSSPVCQLCICACVCMRARVCECVYIFVCVCMRACWSVRVCVCVHVYVYVCVGVCMCVEIGAILAHQSGPYKVTTTQRMPCLVNHLISANQPLITGLFCRKWPAKLDIQWVFAYPIQIRMFDTLEQNIHTHTCQRTHIRWTCTHIYTHIHTPFHGADTVETTLHQDIIYAYIHIYKYAHKHTFSTQSEWSPRRRCIKIRSGTECCGVLQSVAVCYSAL